MLKRRIKKIPHQVCPCWHAPQANLCQRHLPHINSRNYFQETKKDQVHKVNNQWVKKN